jgi:hypothetical protein
MTNNNARCATVFRAEDLGLDGPTADELFATDRKFFEDNPHRIFHLRFAVPSGEVGCFGDIVIVLKRPDLRWKSVIAPVRQWSADDLALCANDKDGARLWKDVMRLSSNRPIARTMLAELRKAQKEQTQRLKRAKEKT